MARERAIWGGGTPLQEFMYTDDCADAPVLLRRHCSTFDHVNVGIGKEVLIVDLPRILARVIGFHGKLELEAEKPDGKPQKLMDSSRHRDLGWSPGISLGDGLAATCQWFLDSNERPAGRTAHAE